MFPPVPDSKKRKWCYEVMREITEVGSFTHLALTLQLPCGYITLPLVQMFHRKSRKAGVSPCPFSRLQGINGSEQNPDRLIDLRFSFLLKKKKKKKTISFLNREDKDTHVLACTTVASISSETQCSKLPLVKVSPPNNLVSYPFWMCWNSC